MCELFDGNYHAEHLSGGGADPASMSATHCGEKICPWVKKPSSLLDS